MRNSVPRKFDRALVESTKLEDLPEAMRHRYPHLTPEQHEWRYSVAIHEAGHLMTALVLSRTHGFCFGTHGFVRVPKRNPHTNQAGTDGEIPSQIGGAHTKTIVTASGIAADALTFGIAFAKERRIRGNYDDDVEQINENVKRLGESTGHAAKTVRLQIVRNALDIIRSSRVPLEKLAIALLLHGDRAGVVRHKQWYGLLGYFLPRC